MENSSHTMNNRTIVVDRLGKDFNRKSIFRDVSFSLSFPDSIAITGKNGAGKSTLSKILAGLIQSSKGSIVYSLHDTPMEIEEFKHHIGFVSPYLNLYEEFTALENLHVLSRIRATEKIDKSELRELLEAVNLWHRRDDFVSTFSSGMKQRLKYAFALLHHPAVLILDEPTSNLDDEGIDFVQHLVQKQKEEGVLIIATNDSQEAQWCSQNIRIGV
jgi:heme exporter protein A